MNTGKNYSAYTTLTAKILAVNLIYQVLPSKYLLLVWKKKRAFGSSSKYLAQNCVCFLGKLHQF